MKYDDLLNLSFEYGCPFGVENHEANVKYWERWIEECKKEFWKYDPDKDKEISDRLESEFKEILGLTSKSSHALPRARSEFRVLG